MNPLLDKEELAAKFEAAGRAAGLQVGNSLIDDLSPGWGERWAETLLSTDFDSDFVELEKTFAAQLDDKETHSAIVASNCMHQRVIAQATRSTAIERTLLQPFADILPIQVHAEQPGRLRDAMKSLQKVAAGPLLMITASLINASQDLSIDLNYLTKMLIWSHVLNVKMAALRGAKGPNVFLDSDAYINTILDVVATIESAYKDWVENTNDDDKERAESFAPLLNGDQRSASIEQRQYHPFLPLLMSGEHVTLDQMIRVSAVRGTTLGRVRTVGTIATFVAHVLVLVVLFAVITSMWQDYVYVTHLTFYYNNFELNRIQFETSNYHHAFIEVRNETQAMAMDPRVVQFIGWIEVIPPSIPLPEAFFGDWAVRIMHPPRIVATYQQLALELYGIPRAYRGLTAGAMTLFTAIVLMGMVNFSRTTNRFITYQTGRLIAAENDLKALERGEEEAEAEAEEEEEEEEEEKKKEEKPPARARSKSRTRRVINAPRSSGRKVTSTAFN